MTLTLTEDQLAAIQRRITSKGRLVKGKAGAESVGAPPKRGPDKKPRLPRGKRINQGETWLAFSLGEARIDGWEREFQFHPERKWRFDFAFPPIKLAVEIDGGVHVVRERWRRDLDKHNAAQLAGWLVIRLTPEMAPTKAAIELIQQAISQRVKTAD